VIRGAFAVRKNHKTGGNLGILHEKLNHTPSSRKTEKRENQILMRERRATQTREINGHGSTREKRTKKLNTDISARGGAGPKRSGGRRWRREQLPKQNLF